MSGDLHVVFGTGPLGLAVMRALRGKGQRVRMVNRSGRAAVPEGVDVAAADVLADAASACRACDGASVVYNCTNPRYHEWATQLAPLFGGVLEAAASVGARLVVGDNVYMYGEVDGPITEDLPYRATTKKGRLRAQVAEAMLAAHRAGRVQVAIGRGSDFFGPHVLGSALGDRAILPALRGKTASLVGDIDQPHTYTYIEDFGRALVIMGERSEALGQAWHVPNAETVTTRRLMTMVFEELGLPPKMSAMGRMTLRLGGLFVPEAREMVEMAYQFERPFVVDGSKFQRTFGLEPSPLRDAVKATVDWYRTRFGAVRP